MVRVFRDSKVLEFSIKLATHKRLVPAHIKGAPPSYYIVAGFVFTAISVPYLRSEVLFTDSSSPYLLTQLCKASLSLKQLVLVTCVSVASNISLKANDQIQLL